MGAHYSESPPGPTRGTSHSDHVQGPPRKKMRKGTKSCLECRRRKIKCTFEPGSTAVCKECYARGSTCIDQEHGDLQAVNSVAVTDQTYSLRERVTQLEGLVKEVLNRLPNGGDRSSSASSSAAADTHSGNEYRSALCHYQTDLPPAAVVLKSLRNTSTVLPAESSLPLPSGLREDAPALSLFDNAVLTRKDDPPQISRERYNKNKALTQGLTAMLPGARELNILLDVSQNWWVIWRKMFPEITDRRCSTIKESISHSLRSENPAEVAKMILCIAISIDQLPSDWDFSQLHLDGSPQELMERYIATVDQLITSDDEIAGTVDGIECMFLQGKYYINIGRPRRAWLVFRRAISFAQLLGLHRLALMKPAKPDLQHTRQVSLWAHLFQGDQYLALTLGLPLNIQSQFCDPCIPPIGQPTEHTEGDAFLLRMSPIVAKIADRNQNPTLDFSLTLRLDQEMDELAQSVSQDWWGKTDALAPPLEDHYDRLLSQFYFHLVRKLLHLPFMLKSSADKRYQYSYTAALDSSRDMIRFYDALRGSDTVGPYICKLVDFQAFSAAMLILLNLYGYSQGVQKNVEQDQSDSALVDTTIEILRGASKEAGGIVAAQSLKALEMIAEARHGCKEEHHGQTIKVSIPYFGTVTVGAGKNFQIPKPGVYPRSAARPRQQNCAPAPALRAKAPSNAGLPTPPSATASTSHVSPPASLPNDPSCSSTTTSLFPSPYTADSLSYTDVSSQPEPPRNQNNHTNSNFADDPFISFDSYLAVPPIGFGGMNMDHFQTGLTPGLEAGGPEMMNGMNNGFPWLGAGLDLDAGWNWFGTEGVAFGNTANADP